MTPVLRVAVVHVDRDRNERNRAPVCRARRKKAAGGTYREVDRVADGSFEGVADGDDFVARRERAIEVRDRSGALHAIANDAVARGAS